MKILIIPSWYPNSFNSLGGIFFKEQAEALVKYGHDVSVIYASGYSVREILKYKKLVFKNNIFTDTGVDTYMAEYPAIPKLKNLRDKISFYFFKKMFEAYKKKNGLPDIVHVHSYSAGVFALWIQKTYNIPYVVTEHFTGFARGLLSKPQLEVAKQVFKNSRANIAVSGEFEKLLENMFDVEFEYIPNIVNTEFFSLKRKSDDGMYRFINIAFLDTKKNQSMLIEAFAKAFRSQFENNFISVSRLQKWKRVDRSLDVYKQYKQYDNSSRFVIVGDGEVKIDLEKYVLDKNIEDMIFTGGINADEVNYLLSHSNIFLSHYELSNVGNPLWEAINNQCLVVTVNNGDTGKIIKDNFNGIISDEKDYLDNAQKLIRLSKNEIEEILQKATKTLKENVISWDERMEIEYLEVMNEIK